MLFDPILLIRLHRSESVLSVLRTEEFCEQEGGEKGQL